MAQQVINTGAAPNDTTGDTLRTSFTKCNANFTELYAFDAAVPATYAPLASPIFTGDPKSVTPATADDDTSIATTAFVKAQGYAPLASPVLTGAPTAPTPTAGDNDTSIATTAFVTAAVGAGNASLTPQHGRLVYVSGSQIKFIPFGGDQIKINGVLYTIPSSGITSGSSGVYLNGTAGQGLSPGSTTYLATLFNNAGTLTFDFLTSLSHATDTTAGNVGVEIKTGDSTRTVVGMVRLASSAFQDNDKFRLTLSWFNRRNRELVSNPTAGQTTAASALTELSSACRIEYLNWAEEGFFAAVQGSYSINAPGTGGSAVGLDGTGSGNSVFTSGQNMTIGTAAWSGALSGLRAMVVTEGYHYCTILGHSGGVGGSFYLTLNAIIRG